MRGFKERRMPDRFQNKGQALGDPLSNKAVLSSSIDGSRGWGETERAAT